jgi:hypothetical protein
VAKCASFQISCCIRNTGSTMIQLHHHRASMNRKNRYGNLYSINSFSRTYFTWISSRCGGRANVSATECWEVIASWIFLSLGGVAEKNCRCPWALYPPSPTQVFIGSLCMLEVTYEFQHDPFILAITFRRGSTVSCGAGGIPCVGRILRGVSCRTLQ